MELIWSKGMVKSIQMNKSAHVQYVEKAVSHEVKKKKILR
jgi:hypothetical protein